MIVSTNATERNERQKRESYGLTPCCGGRKRDRGCRLESGSLQPTRFQLDMQKIALRRKSYLRVVLVEEGDDPNVVLEGDNMGFREHFQLGHVGLRS